MTLDILFALLTFSAVTVFSPGPNNLMLMASGANFGFRRTIPHMFGIILGFPAMILLVGLGIMALFDLWPVLNTVLKVVSVAYMLFLAWKIANAAPPQEASTEARPLTFLQSAAFQWVNPKAWAMALGAISLYAGGRETAAVAWVAGCYVVTAVFSTSLWAMIGQQVRRLLRNPFWLRLFNWAMAGLLILSLAPVLMGP